MVTPVVVCVNNTIVKPFALQIKRFLHFRHAPFFIHRFDLLQSSALRKHALVRLNDLRETSISVFRRLSFPGQPSLLSQAPPFRAG